MKKDSEHYQEISLKEMWKALQECEELIAELQCLLNGRILHQELEFPNRTV